MSLAQLPPDVADKSTKDTANKSPPVIVLSSGHSLILVQLFHLVLSDLRFCVCTCMLGLVYVLGLAVYR